jgi:AbrB family looped-hinge helix DNA binding protein
MAESTVTAKGQTTIPKAIRDLLGLKPGGKVRYFAAHNGRVMILPVQPASALRGMVKYDGPPISIEDMDDAIAAEVSERDMRSRAR